MTFQIKDSITVNETVVIDTSGNLLTSAPAGSLSGTTLKSTVVNSSLTSVGTLTSLNVTSTSGSNSNVLSITGVVSAGHGGTATWNFQTEGSSLGGYNSRIAFPDSTYQYTAWTGSVSSLVNGSYTVSLDSSGNLLLPANGSYAHLQTSTNGSYLNIQANSTTANYTPQIQLIPTSTGGIQFYTNTGTKSWLFDQSGNLVFPDSTSQATAWTGAAPAGSLSGTALKSTVVTSSLTSVGTLSSLSVTGQITQTYTSTGAGSGASLQASGSNTQGGTNYFDFLKVTNTAAGATTPNKYFRVDNYGSLEIISSDYTTSLLLLSNAGVLNTKVYQVNGKQAVNGPAFSAYQSVIQSIPTDVQTKVTFTSVDYDTNSNFANSRFTPTVEGYYQLSGAVRVDSGIGTGERMIVIYKNGSEYLRAYNTRGTAAVGDSWFQMEINGHVYANGTGDYFEIYMMHGAGANRSLTTARAFTRFQGCMIRGA